MREKKAILCALLAAAFYAVNVPCSKLLLAHAGAATMAALLYLGAGLGIAGLARETVPPPVTAALALLLGFVAYGLSIFLYVRAQNTLGAAKTSAYYAVAPFIGMFLSFLLLRERLTGLYLLALAVMAAGTVLVTADTLEQ